MEFRVREEFGRHIGGKYVEQVGGGWRVGQTFIYRK